MEHSQTTTFEEEGQKHLRNVTSIYMNVIYQLLKLIAWSLADETLRQITAKITEFTFNLINDEFKKSYPGSTTEKETEA